MWNLKKSNSQNQRAEGRLPGAEGEGNGKLLVNRYKLSLMTWS